MRLIKRLKYIMKHIELTKNKIAVIDDEDYKLISLNQWYEDKNYAVRVITIQKSNKIKGIKSKRERIYMHTVILENKLGRKLKKEEEVDHINGNGLDNRRCNLRPCTHSQNQANGVKYKTYNHQKTTSKYKGVSWRKDCSKWHARIRYQKKLIHLGHFNDEIRAAEVYDEAAKKYFGEFARINFNVRITKT